MVANGALLVTGVTGWRLDRCTEQLGNLFTIQIVQPQHKLLLTLPLVPLTWIAASSSSFSTLNVQLQINFHNWFGAVHIHLIYSYMYVCPVIWLVNEQLGHFLNYTYRCHFWTLLLKPHFYHIMKLTGTFPAAANHSAFWKFSYCVLRIWLEISIEGYSMFWWHSTRNIFYSVNHIMIIKVNCIPVGVVIYRNINRLVYCWYG